MIPRAALALLVAFGLAIFTSTCGDSSDTSASTATVRKEQEEVPAPPMPPRMPTTAPTATPRPEPTETPEPRVVMDVLGHDTFRDAFSNGLWVVGEVQNDGDGPATKIDIAASLISRDGQVLAVGEAFPEDTRLRVPVGEKAPFHAFIPNAPETWDSVKLQPQAEPFDDFTASHLYLDFKVQHETLVPPVDRSRGYTLVGEVANTGQTTAEFVRVVAAGYSLDGKLVDVAAGNGTLEVVEPGETTPFGLEFQPGREVDTYRIYVGSNRKT